MELEGCHVKGISDVSSVISWVAAKGTKPDTIDKSIKWLLVHDNDGIIWGRLEKEWILSSSLYPDISPQLSATGIQQMRLFGEDAEIMIWREGDQLEGRIAEDRRMNTKQAISELRPSEESILLLADRVVANHPKDFTVVASSSGSRQVLPVRVTADDYNEVVRTSQPRIHIRHYFTVNEQTGELKLSLTRFVTIGGD